MGGSSPSHVSYNGDSTKSGRVKILCEAGTRGAAPQRKLVHCLPAGAVYDECRNEDACWHQASLKKDILRRSVMRLRKVNDR